MNLDNLVVFDCEVYPNYFLVAFKQLSTGKTKLFATDDKLREVEITAIKNILTKRTVFGFNSRNYDVPVLAYALKGHSTEHIYQLSKSIIESGDPGWMTLNNHGLSWQDHWKHFDIAEPSPGVMISLKLYGARLHSKRLQDLPYDPHMELDAAQMGEVARYCINDLDTTIDLYNEVKDRIGLRADLSERYKVDLMSKSDAQIAEAVIKARLGGNPKRPNIPKDVTYRYDVPEFIRFKTDELNDVLALIREHDFELDGKGSIKLPDALSKKSICIGTTQYQLGVGGLHSKESKQVVVTDENTILADRDVTSYYPSIILQQGLYPKQLSKRFLSVYEDIVNERLAAKAKGDKLVAESLKIVINGSFGKFGNKYSILYSPKLLMQVTLTGQLALLMLIERIEAAGMRVVSANTDGFVTLMNKDQYDDYDYICFSWEIDTGFALEETRYRALYSRDVNNYLAIKEDGSHKGKGVFVTDSIGKNPMAEICAQAVIEYLKHGDSINDHIRSCNDIKQFLCVRKVTGGAQWRDEYLGKVVRWYYSTDGDPIKYVKNGNKVSMSDGAKPLMDLTALPDDIDYKKYCDEAMKLLRSLGINA